MDNEIFPLDGEVLVDKVLEESPVYECGGVVLYLDNENHPNNDYYSRAEVVFENPVPIHDEEKKLIGFADLSVVCKAIEARCFLDYHTPERLSIETSSEKLYPSLVAQEVMIKMDDTVYVVIKSITLTKSPQPDSRILPL